MATKTPQFVDLFGNSTLTPRQVVQQQIAESIEGAQASFAGARPSTQLGATLGAAAGGLFRQVLIDKGVLPKDPEQEQAEKLQILREDVNKTADERGISITDDMESYADLVAGKALKLGMEDVAFRAVQMKMLLQAQKRTAELESAKARKTLAEAEKAETEAAAAPALNAATIQEKMTQANLNEVRAAGLKVLTQLKQTDPNRAKVQRFNRIMESFEARLKKDPNATFTVGERKQLDELARVDAVNKLLGQILGAGTSSTSPEVIDLTGTP